MKSPIHAHLPHVGARLLKSVLAATLVAFVYDLLDRNACFACIGAVYGMGATWKDGAKTGFNRFIGTLIGGLLAIPIYWLTHLTNFPVPQWLLMGAGLFVVLYVSLMFEANSAIQPGSVVFFVVLYTVTQERFVSYTIARIIDTGIGVLFALLINIVWPSPLDKKAHSKMNQTD